MPADLVPTTIDAREIEALSQELTAQQQSFCEIYAADPKANGTRAAKGAGCGSGAKVSACRWLKMPHVQAEIARIKAELLEQAGVSRFAILMETAKVARSRIKTVGGPVKLRALELLGRWTGMEPKSNDEPPIAITGEQITVNIRRVGA